MVMPMGNSFVLIVFSVGCGIGGQLALKAGMTQVGQIGPQTISQSIAVALRVASSPLVLAGLALYALGAVAWLTVLSRVPLSFAYPLLAVSYAFTPLLAWLVLRESVPSLRWAGIATICLGVFLVSRS